jgi:uncharacterized protein (TIGR02099 family)
VTTFWRKVVVRLGYFAAGIIILSALLVSVTRLLTPLLNDHRADFEKMASRLMDRPVHIENINIKWDVLEPELALQNVTLLDPNGDKPVLDIPLIIINLSIFHSLLSREFIMDSMTVSDVHLTLHQQTTGEINLQGFTTGLTITDTLSGNALNSNAVFAWIFSQPNLILRNFAIQFIPASGKTKSVTLKFLALQNSSDKHQLKGKAILNQAVPTKITIDFKCDGAVTDLSHISANLYLYLEGISLPQWLSDRSWHDLSIQSAIGNAKIWAVWNKNAWQKIQTTLQFYNIDAQSQTIKKAINISRLSGNFGWERLGENEIITGENILTDLPSHLWPNTNFKLRYLREADGTVTVKHFQADYIDLADSADLITATGLLQKDNQSWLTHLNPKGELRNLNVDVNGPLNEFANVSIFTNFSGIALDAWQKIPRLQNLKGVIEWNGKQGDFKLDSQNALINLTQVFGNSLEFDQLTSTVHGQLDATGTWLFTAKNIQAINSDVNVSADATLRVPKNDSMSIDLTGKFTLLNAARVSNYLPLKLYDPELVTWLRHAFISGQATAGKAILQGKLADFPFDNGAGKFEISALAQNLEFNYAPGWPLMHNVSGKLIFSGRSMSIDLLSGKIMDVPILSAHAEIPYFGDAKPQVLSVKGKVQGDLAQGMEFIQQSLLQKTIGKNLSELQMKGLMQLDLGLTIPLATPKDAKVDGKTAITNATLNLPDWNLVLQNLSGTFNFSEENITASNMTGQLFSHPITLNLATEHPSGKSGYVTAELQGVINTNDLKTWLELPVDQLMQGTTNYRAELKLPPEGQSSTQVVVSSDLKGIAVNLPGNYGKKADATTNFQFLLSASGNQPLKTKFTYDKLFSAALTLQRVKQKFTLLSGNVNLGSGSANWQTQPGIIVTGNLDELNWDKIQPYVTQFTANKKTNAAKTNSSLINPDMFRALDIKVNSANLGGIKLDRIRIQLTKQGNKFALGLTNNDLAGQILLPTPDAEQIIQAKFQYLHLMPQSKDGFQSKLNPKTLPAISFVSDDVRYGDMDLGHVTFNSIPASNGLLIKQFDLTSSAYTLHAMGDWTGNSSHLQGKINTSNVSEVVKAWGFSSADLVGGDGDANFDLRWAGAPFKPSMQGLSGNISFKLGKGRIINLSESTDAKMGLGRLLSVFSLQSLPRRLSLDFSDLFEKGYSFDSLKGDFTLKNGNAMTQNTQFNGPIAGIAITGRIGFIAKDFDMKLNVTPYVTSSLPVLTALATVNPIAGIATWMVGSAMSQMITYTYTITGSWDNPIWTQVGKQKTTQQRR